MSRMNSTPAWSLSKLEIRAPAAAGCQPVARVELIHSDRGRISDVAVGSGPLAAICSAVNHIVGIDAEIETTNVREEPDEHLFVVQLSTKSGEHRRTSEASGADLLTTCVSAYLTAVSELASLAEAQSQKRAHVAHMELMRMNRGCCA